MTARRLAVVLFFICALRGPCSAARAQDTVQLTVSAAMSLKNAFTEIGSIFEKKHAGSQVCFNFASSGDLQKQLAQGAPADVYASASRKYMDMLERNNRIVAGLRTDFAQNSIILIRPSSASGCPASFEDLAKAGTIAIGNPASVPVGRYAVEALRHLGLYGILKDRIVFAEHVRQVLDYVARGEVDAGIVYASDAGIRPDRITVAAAAPSGSHTPIRYPIAVVAGTRHRDLAAAFVSFVAASPEAGAVLRRNGFIPATEPHSE